MQRWTAASDYMTDLKVTSIALSVVIVFATIGFIVAWTIPPL
jgi:hypothetical protein